MHLDKMANYGNNDMYEYEMSIKKKKKQVHFKVII